VRSTSPSANPISERSSLIGSYYELGSPEYDALLPPGTRQPGSRAVIILEVYKVATVSLIVE
jgi:hypothetical protein